MMDQNFPVKNLFGNSGQRYYGTLTYPKSFHRFLRHEFTIWYKRKGTPLRFFRLDAFSGFLEHRLSYYPHILNKESTFS